MRLLVLGGTSFVGRHLVDSALERGHDVAVFNRGRTNPGLWADVEELRGDRNGDLGALQGHRWDTVVDTSGYVPRIVRASAELLRDAVHHYIFISSVSVYADFRRGPDETGAVEQLAVADSEDVEQHYGALKAECERTVEKVFPDAALIIRPGLIVGPWDPTGRFTYWPLRIARGGDVLVPEPRTMLRAVHRRARPRRLGRAHGRAASNRALQRDGPGPAPNSRGSARDLPPSGKP